MHTSRGQEYILTLNNMGYMTRTCDHVQKAFIDFACAYPTEHFLDIGCAFGNTTKPLVSKGIHVSVCDLDREHLETLVREVDPAYRSFITCYQGHFPRSVRPAPESFRGVLMAMVLHFLEPEYVDKAFESIYSSLKSGGKLFLTVSTPYQGVLKDFIPVYQERKKKGCHSPGLIEDIGKYTKLRQKDLPKRNIVYCPGEVEVLCRKAGLNVEESDFFTRYHIPEDLKLDGREYAYVVACKP